MGSNKIKAKIKTLKEFFKKYYEHKVKQGQSLNTLFLNIGDEIIEKHDWKGRHFHRKTSENTWMDQIFLKESWEDILNSLYFQNEDDDYFTALDKFDFLLSVFRIIELYGNNTSEPDPYKYNIDYYINEDNPFSPFEEYANYFTISIDSPAPTNIDDFLNDSRYDMEWFKEVLEKSFAQFRETYKNATSSFTLSLSCDGIDLSYLSPETYVSISENIDIQIQNSQIIIHGRNYKGTPIKTSQKQLNDLQNLFNLLHLYGILITKEEYELMFWSDAQEIHYTIKTFHSTLLKGCLEHTENLTQQLVSEFRIHPNIISDFNIIDLNLDKENFFTSLHFYNLGSKSTSAHLKFLQYWIAIECLLESTSDRAWESINENFKNLIKDDSEDIEADSRELQTFWNLRCGVVHKGKISDISDKHVADIQKFCGSLLKYYLKKYIPTQT